MERWNIGIRKPGSQEIRNDGIVELWEKMLQVKTQ